jgi:hypothetical protein
MLRFFHRYKDHHRWKRLRIDFHIDHDLKHSKSGFKISLAYFKWNSRISSIIHLKAKLIKASVTLSELFHVPSNLLFYKYLITYGGALFVNTISPYCNCLSDFYINICNTIIIKCLYSFLLIIKRLLLNLMGWKSNRRIMLKKQLK